MNPSTKKILLGMLVSNGDCLMATVIARQIKKDFPGCHLTWAISDLCLNMILNNPDVDNIWEVKLSSKQAGLKEEWYAFRKEADERKNRGEFDEMFFTQIYPDNVYHFDGTTRGTIYGSYPNPVTVNARPVLRLTIEENENIHRFAEIHELKKYKQVILMECSSFSGQSFVNTKWAMDLSKRLVESFPEMLILISTHEKLPAVHPRVIPANEISLRENVGLSHYCSLLVGCSSGVTWACTSEDAKRLPMIQFLKRAKGFSFASVAYDHAWWKLDNSKIVESTRKSVEDAFEIISTQTNKGMEITHSLFNETLRPRIISMYKYAFMFLRRGQIGKSLQIIKNWRRRNGH